MTNAADVWLEHLLADGPIRCSDACARAVEAGFSERGIKRAANRIGVLKQRVGFGPGGYVQWMLPRHVGV